MKMLSYYVLITLFIAGCTPSNELCQRVYQFKAEIQAIPNKTKYMLGDTIQVSSIISKLLLDKSCDELINVGSAFGFPLQFFIMKVDSLGEYSSLYDFELIYQVGTYSIFDIGTNQALKIEYEIIDTNRVFTFSIIPKMHGTFYLAFGYNSLLYAGDHIAFTKNCDEGIILHLATNGGVGNYNLLLDTGNDEIVRKEVFEGEAGFAFEVLKWKSESVRTTTGPCLSFQPDSWIPEGVFLDCIDDNLQNPSLVVDPVLDNVKGYALSSCFSSITASPVTVQSVRDILRDNFLPVGQNAADVDSLFSEYGY